MNLSHCSLTLFQEVAGMLFLGMFVKSSFNFLTLKLRNCSPCCLLNFGTSTAF